MSESITLEINVPAPLFDLTDIFGRRITLDKFKGKKVLVAFYRHAGCPYCNLRIHTLQKVTEELKSKNMEMIFFFESSQKLLLSSIFHKEVNPTPLISDPDKVWYNIYGIENSPMKSAIGHITSILPTVIKAKMKGLPVHMMAEKESISTIPAEFLIDEKGIIKKVHYATKLSNQLSVEVITKFAETGNV